jgi:hypothetical protein
MGINVHLFVSRQRTQSANAQAWQSVMSAVTIAIVRAARDRASVPIKHCS